MTYRQLFDEAIGEAPPSSVDVDRVVAREVRRFRARRTRAAGIAAVAVLAATFGIGALRDDARPMSGATTTIAVTDQERLTKAMLAALDREAPRLGWVTGATGKTDTWNGPVTTRSTWQVNEVSGSSYAGWFGWAVVVRGDVRARVSIQVVTPNARATDKGACARSTPNCTVSQGPNGERVRAETSEAYRGQPTGGEFDVMTDVNVTVFRPDGTEVKATARTAKGETLLTPDQLTRIALDPAVAID
ncbi:hypothetical protein [Asanoa sp. NPDC050611]|uniref:hypothetical protein n=1 Tax=Asanoa sp. NPDC050611 TaxID=3157098 RepID=UPI0033CFE5F1